MIIGVSLMIIGVVLPWLMVLQLIKPTFFLTFLSHGCSVSGMFLGFLGIFNYVKTKRR